MRKFSIVIPTRERADTLRFALQTCTAQTYSGLEILVSDNFSQDGTEDLVKSFLDPRLRYINTGNRVSMSRNWEFALSNVTGDYVMFLGDDDGVLPGAIEEMANVIERTSARALAWTSAVYNWPNHIDEHARNLLIIPIGGGVYERKTDEVLSNVLQFKASYEELPMIYRGLVSIDVLKNARKLSGCFFHSMIPDVYSGMVVALSLDSYHYCERPFTLSGVSVHSGGTAAFSKGGKSREAELQFLQEGDIPFHPKLRYAPSFPIIVAESFLQASVHFPSAARFTVSWRELITVALKQSKHQSHINYQRIIDCVREIAEINGLGDFAASRIAKSKNVPLRALRKIEGINLFLREIVVDTLKWRVTDVLGAAKLCDFVLRSKKSGYLEIWQVVKTNFLIIRRELLKRRI